MSPESKAKLVAQLSTEEGLVLHAYQDSLGYWTIGRGRMIDARKGGGISVAEADYLFANDVDSRVKQLSQYDWFSSQDEVRQAALVDLHFNVDLLHWPHFLGFMADHDYPKAKARLVGTPWEHEVGPNRSARIEGMIESGVWP